MSNSIDSTESSDSSSTEDDHTGGHDSIKVVLTALSINITIAVMKGIASILSGSASMLSETIHSFVDCGNQFFLLLGAKLAKKDACVNHPLGHGREIFLWSFMVSISLFLFGGVSAIYEGIQKIIHPEAFQTVHMFGFTFKSFWMNITILVISAILEANGFKTAWNSMMRGQKLGVLKVLKNSTNPDVFICFMEDGIALFGLSIAGVATIIAEVFNLPIMDGIASVLIGAMLLVVSLFIGRESKSLLIGESNKIVDSYAREVIKNTVGVTGINEVLSEQRGPHNVILFISIDWDNNLTAGEVETKSSAIESTIRTKYSDVKRVFVEAQSFEKHKEFEFA